MSERIESKSRQTEWFVADLPGFGTRTLFVDGAYDTIIMWAWAKQYLRVISFFI